MLKKLKWPLVVVGSAAAATVVASWLSRPTLASTGRLALDCIASGDGQCLYNLTTGDERQAYGLTPAKVGRLLHEYVLPAARPVKRTSATFDGLPKDSKLIAEQQWTASSGKEQGMGVFVSMTDDGIKCPYLIGGLLLSVAVYERHVPSTGTKPLDKLLAWRDGAVQDKAQLEQLGFAGLYRDEEEGLIKWDDWIANCNERIEKLQAKVDKNATQ